VSLLVDTAAVGEDERAGFWAQAQEDLFFPLEWRSREGAAFPGRAHGHELGPVIVRRVVAGASRAERTPRTIARADPERLEVTLIVRGSQEREQDGRRAVLAAGVILTRGTPIFDLVRETVYRSDDGVPLEVPEAAVVVPGARAIRSGWGASELLSLQTPVIVKYRDERTDVATALESWLR
jgi:hypothetical protein